MNFGEKIKKIRKDNNLSQDEFANKIFISRTAVSKWETNNGYPSIETIKIITKVFNITFDELINDEDIENKKILEDKQAKSFYYGAICGFLIMIVFSFLVRLLQSEWYYVGVFCGFAIYIICAYFVTPKYKRIEKAKNKFSYIFPKVLIALIFVGITLSICFM